MPAADQPPAKRKPANPATADRLAALEARCDALEARNADMDARAEQTLEQLRLAAAKRHLQRPEVQDQMAAALVKSALTNETL